VAVFLELTVDPFIERFRKTAEERARTKGAGLSRVRRPLRGLEVKEDTYAYIKLIRADGIEIDLIDAGASEGWTKEYSNFILQSVQEHLMERHQIIETFGDTYVFLFGAAPHMLQCSAILINSHDFNWKDEFMENYNKYMRGTKALEYGARTYLFYDQNIVEGYILNASVNITSNEPLMAQLQFQFFVTNSQTVAMLGDPWFPVRDSVVLPEGVTLVETWDGQKFDMVLDQTLEGSEYWENGSTWIQDSEGNWIRSKWNRSRPIREKTASPVSDEYTTPMQPTAAEISGLVRGRNLERTLAAIEAERLQEIEDLDKALNTAMTRAGADGTDDPSFWEEMGLAPHWTENGVSFGNGSTPFGGGVSWGSFPGSSQVGGFVGKNVDIPDALGDIGNALKGLPGPFGDAGKAVVGATESAADWVSDQGKSGYGWASGKVNSAYASSKEWAEGAASDAMKAAADAGGYLGVNQYLSWLAKNAPVRVDANMNSSGASVDVPGSPVPFAFVSAKGSFNPFWTTPENELKNQ
jgi:hypothetical protein